MPDKNDTPMTARARIRGTRLGAIVAILGRAEPARPVTDSPVQSEGRRHMSLISNAADDICAAYVI